MDVGTVRASRGGRSGYTPKPCARRRVVRKGDMLVAFADRDLRLATEMGQQRARDSEYREAWGHQRAR